MHVRVIASALLSRKKILRIAQEQATMASSLPVEYASSIFLRFDEDHMDLMQATIIGPPDTPYSNGLFVFDAYCPQSYPSRPPLVNLRTTGGGIVRFSRCCVCVCVCVCVADRDLLPF
jgi:baculoviral IAP repeat-containing protein 6 (apollon)